MVELRYKKIICFVLCIVMIFTLCGCTTFNNFKAAFIDKKEEEIKIVKIGVLEPITGIYAQDAADEIKGIEFAHKLYNEVEGGEIELVYADNQSEVSLCETAVQSLIDAGVSVILGSYNSVLTLASSNLIKEAKIPAIAISNTNPIVTSTNNYYFRVCFTDAYEGDVAANFILKQLQTTNAAVFLKEGNDYASALAEAFNNKFEEVSGEYDLATNIMYPAETIDFGIIFENLAILSPDAIFFPGTIEEAKPIIEASRQAGYNFRWIGTSKWDGIDVDNIYYTLDYDPDEQQTVMSSRLKLQYKQANGKEANPSENVALGFDAYLLARNAIHISDEIDNKEMIKSAIEFTRDLEGATGYITMSSSGDPEKEVIVEYTQDGKRSRVYTMTPTGEAREEENKGE